MIYIYKTIIFFENEKGQDHRLNGPAVIDGISGPSLVNEKYQAWWSIEGVKYTESEFYNKLKEMGLG